jgi:hypothetical protein
MIHWWKPMPPGEQGLRRQWLPTDGAKLGNWLTGSRDRDLLAQGGSIDHLAAMVAQFADRDFSHVSIVSRVIQRRLRVHGRVRAEALVNVEHAENAAVLFDPVDDAAGTAPSAMASGQNSDLPSRCGLTASAASQNFSTAAATAWGSRWAIARRAAGWNRISYRCPGSAVTCR